MGDIFTLDRSINSVNRNKQPKCALFQQYPLYSFSRLAWNLLIVVVRFSALNPINKLQDISLRTLFHFLVLVMISTIANTSVAAELPRMWVATKPGTGPTIYILGITHAGVDAEYDAYLDRKILPAARRAGAFYLEGVGPPRAVGSEPACDQPLTDPEALAIEARARTELATLEFENLRGMRDSGIAFQRAHDAQLRALAGSDAQDLTELGLMGAFEIHGKPQKLPVSGIRGSVAALLMKSFDPIQVHDIDEADAYAKAYCGMGPSRIKYFYNRTIGRNLEQAPDSTRQVSDVIDALNRDFIETIRQRKAQGSLTSPVEWDGSLTCARNAQWARKLDSQVAGSVLFTAVGVAHLFPIPNLAVRCDGLLKNLVDQGYSVHLVE